MKFRNNWLFRTLEASFAFIASLCFFIPFYFYKAVDVETGDKLDTKWFSNLKIFTDVFGKDQDTVSLELFGTKSKGIIFLFAIVFLLMLVSAIVSLCVRKVSSRKVCGIILDSLSLGMMVIFIVMAMIGLSNFLDDNSVALARFDETLVLRPHVGFIIYIIFAITTLVLHCVDHEFKSVAPIGGSDNGQSIYKNPTPAPQPVKANAAGAIKGLSGTYAGSTIGIPAGQKLVIGSAPESCNVVIANSQYISRIHCSVRFDPDTNQYMVKDHSKNHTFMQNGVILQNGVYTYLPKGSIIYLATTENMFQLM